MTRTAIIIILIMVLTIGVIWAWEEDVLLATSYYQQWKKSTLADEIIYSCWEEEADSSFVIKVQGLNREGEEIWDEPAEIIPSQPICEDYQLCAEEDGFVFLSWKSYTAEYIFEGIYVQKIDSNCQLMWGETGHTYPFPYFNYTIESDHTGSIYVFQNYSNIIRCWHIGEDGEILANWDNGIVVGIINRLDHEITEDGDIALFRNLMYIEEPGMYFQILQGDGSYFYEDYGIWCGDSNSDTAEMEAMPNGGYLLAWVYEDELQGNVLLSNGELLYEDAVFLGNSGESDYLHEMEYQAGSCHLSFNNEDDEQISVWTYNDEFQETGEMQIFPYCYYPYNIQFKPNGNVLIRDGYYNSRRLMEYDEDGGLVSPEEGWITDVEHFSYIGGNDEGECFVELETRENIRTTNYILQGFDQESELIYENEGYLLNQNIYLFGRECEILKMEDKTVFGWWESGSNMITYWLQYLDENGEPLLSDGGYELISRENDYGEYKIMLKEENSMLITESYSDWSWPYEYNYLKLHKVVFNEEPYFEWGVEGIILTEGNYDEVELQKRGEDSYFIYWEGENEIARGQLIIDGECLLPEDYNLGINVGSIISLSGDYCLFKLENEYRITFWNEELEPVWDESVLLTTSGYFDGDVCTFIEDDNLVVYWVSNEAAFPNNYTWRIKKQIITPEGEKLLSNYGDMIYDNGEDEIRGYYILDDLDLILVLCGNNYEFLFKYMTIEGEILNEEYYSIPGLNGREVEDIYSRQGYLVIKTRFYDNENGIQLGFGMYDLEGNSVAGLPDSGFALNDNNNIAEALCTDEEIFWVWEKEKILNEEYFYYDICAQKMDYVSNDAEEEEIVNNIASLRAYPNPFNPEITIQWDISDGAEQVELDIYNIKGQRVRKLKIDQTSSNSGSTKNVKSKINKVVWNGKDNDGKLMPTGIYLIRCQSGTEKLNKKVLLLK